MRKTVFADPDLCKVEDEVVTILKDFEIPELSSPSALAIFCCGGSRNGPKSWSDANGVKYDAKWWAGEDTTAVMQLSETSKKEHIG